MTILNRQPVNEAEKLPPHDVEGKPTGEFVVWLVGSLSDWQQPIPKTRKVISGNIVPILQKARASGKSLRTLAQEFGVSHETIRLVSRTGTEA